MAETTVEPIAFERLQHGIVGLAHVQNDGKMEGLCNTQLGFQQILLLHSVEVLELPVQSDLADCHRAGTTNFLGERLDVLRLVLLQIDGVHAQGEMQAGVGATKLDQRRPRGALNRRHQQVSDAGGACIVEDPAAIRVEFPDVDMTMGVEQFHAVSLPRTSNEDQREADVIIRSLFSIEL